MIWGSDRELLAKDVRPVWKRRVKSAEASVWAFSPYLDRSLVRLLQNTELAPDHICVITDLSPESGAQTYRQQLLAIRSLLLAGIDVRSLPRLHAKVLVIDEEMATIGSQNFTTYGRSSREVTAAPSVDLSETSMMTTLREWRDLALPVHPTLIENLLKLLESQIEAVRDAHQALVDAAQEELQSWQAEREQERLGESRRAAFADNLSRAIDRSRFTRGGQAVAFGVVDTVHRYDYEEIVASYESLLARPAGADLTSWFIDDVDDWRPAHLKRLHFYPMISFPSGRMAFARVARTRITYVKTGVEFNAPKIIGDRRCRVSVDFPQRNASRSNITLSLGPYGYDTFGWRFDLLFDGDSVLLAGHRRIGRSDVWGSIWRDLGLAVLEDPDDAVQMMSGLLTPITYEEIGLAHHNAAGFFGRGWYRIDVIELGDSKVLVARRV